MGEFGRKSVKSRMIQYTNLEVGNEARIKFWIDIWNGDESFKNKFPTLFSCALDKDAHIADFKQSLGWHITFRRNLNDRELISFCQLLQQLHTCLIEMNKSGQISLGQ